MICKNCSASYEGNFCPECGAKSDKIAPHLSVKGAKKHSASKKKRPFYLRWWFIAIVIGLVIFVFSSRSEKIELEDMVLGEMIPELPKDRGEININSSETLDLDLKNVSAKEYSAYTTLCENKGYNVEIESDYDSFEGYNENGYNINLYYSERKSELSITLKAPMKLSEIDWPNSVATSKLPKPKSMVGKFSYEYDDSFFVYIGETTKAEYAKYVSACMEMGFNIDYSKGDDYYFAHNSDGWNIHISYVGNNVMSIDIDPPDEDDFSEEDTVTTTTKASEAKITTESTTKQISTTVEKKYDLDKNLYVVQCTRDSNKTTMYRVTFADCDTNGNYTNFYTFDSIINPHAMGDEFNVIGALPSWFYVGALVHVQANLNNGAIRSYDCTVTKAKTNTNNTTLQMPTMNGSSLNSVVSVAKSYGLSTQFSDEDWGNGSKMRGMSNNKFSIKIVYSSTTKELLMVSVVTYSTNSTTQEQKNFIKAISSTACPASDSTTVSQWVNSNIGNEKVTKINGRTYELLIGSSNNICYSAGNAEWETWELARNTK